MIVPAEADLHNEYIKLLSKIIQLVEFSNFDEIDRLSREFIRKYLPEVEKLSYDELIKFINDVTGGLGFRELNIYDFDNMLKLGSLISWCDNVNENDVILEIGTGLGRTAYTILSKLNPKLYITVDINPKILTIALYKNPISEFQEILHKPCVKIILGDACKIIPRLKIKFTHVIHDGGPNPDKNPKLFSEYFLSKLIDLLEINGKLSIFAGKNPKWIDKIYNTLRKLNKGNVYTCGLSGSNVKVIRFVKLKD